MNLNPKIINDKDLLLVEPYNFDIKFIFIRGSLKIQKIKFYLRLDFRNGSEYLT